jgi:hypothetical protein
MGAGDGYIGATTKIVDHGPDTSRYTIAILGDGYQAGELPKYRTDVQAFIDTIFNTAPYTDVWCGINVYRIDVVSTDSGADDPADCPIIHGPPTEQPRKRSLMQSFAAPDLAAFAFIGCSRSTARAKAASIAYRSGN